MWFMLACVGRRPRRPGVAGVVEPVCARSLAPLRPEFRRRRLSVVEANADRNGAYKGGVLKTMLICGRGGFFLALPLK